MEKGHMFVFAAPSGAGKTTLANEVIKRLKGDFDISKVVTYTTRAPRNNEIHEKDYHFVSVEKFEKLLEDRFFLETTKYAGHFYGSPKRILDELDEGKSFIIVTDLNGVKQIREEKIDATLIWITVSKIEELKKRLIKRDADESVVQKRLKMAEEEMKEVEKPRLFDYIVINENFDQTVQELMLLIKNKISS